MSKINVRKDGHDFSNIDDLPKIDNVKCSKCGLTYYSFLLKEIGIWKQENYNLKKELQAKKHVDGYFRNLEKQNAQLKAEVNKSNKEINTLQELIEQSQDRERVLRKALEKITKQLSAKTMERIAYQAIEQCDSMSNIAIKALEASK